jgi:drug/metabolite transporter (DMT)-like permease
MLKVMFQLRRRFKAQIKYHPIRALPLILASVACAVTGQLLMKYGANHLYGTGLGKDFLAAAGSNPHILAGISCYGLSAFTWLAALGRVDLSFAFPMLSLGFVFTALFSWLKFGETLAWNRILGISLVVLGVLFIALTGGPSEKEEVPGK